MKSHLLSLVVISCILSTALSSIVQIETDSSRHIDSLNDLAEREARDEFYDVAKFIDHEIHEIVRTTADLELVLDNIDWERLRDNFILQYFNYHSQDLPKQNDDDQVSAGELKYKRVLRNLRGRRKRRKKPSKDVSDSSDFYGKDENSSEKCGNSKSEKSKSKKSKSKKSKSKKSKKSKSKKSKSKKSKSKKSKSKKSKGKSKSMKMSEVPTEAPTLEQSANKILDPTTSPIMSTNSPTNKPTIRPTPQPTPLGAYRYNQGNCPNPGSTGLPCAQDKSLESICDKYDAEGRFSKCWEACKPSFCCIHDTPSTNYYAPSCSDDENCAQYAYCYVVWWKLHDTLGPAIYLNLLQDDPFFDVRDSEVEVENIGDEFEKQLFFHHFDDLNKVISEGTDANGEFKLPSIFDERVWWNGRGPEDVPADE